MLTSCCASSDSATCGAQKEHVKGARGRDGQWPTASWAVAHLLGSLHIHQRCVPYRSERRFRLLLVGQLGGCSRCRGHNIYCAGEAFGDCLAGLLDLLRQ